MVMNGAEATLLFRRGCLFFNPSRTDVLVDQLVDEPVYPHWLPDTIQAIGWIGGHDGAVPLLRQQAEEHREEPHGSLRSLLDIRGPSADAHAERIDLQAHSGTGDDVDVTESEDAPQYGGVGLQVLDLLERDRMNAGVEVQELLADVYPLVCDGILEGALVEQCEDDHHGERGESEEQEPCVVPLWKGTGELRAEQAPGPL